MLKHQIDPFRKDGQLAAEVGCGVQPDAGLEELGSGNDVTLPTML